jgi:dynein heavy chain
MGYQTDEAFVTKVVQLKEILDVRHCVFVLGPTGSSKSAVWLTLVQTWRDIGQETEYDTLNPKAITSDELFGCINKAKEW